jgi:hypothetical protein
MSEEKQPVGRTKGPGESPHDFTFVSPDSDHSLRIGEFITYDAEVDGQSRTIFGRVVERRPLRLFPDAFASDPSIEPGQVAEMVGYGQVEHELFEMTATVLGYYDERLGDFINPRIPPREGRPIHLGSDEELSRVLTKRRFGDIGSAHIGSLLTREAGHVPVVLDLSAITSTHLAVIANTGAGKSYLSSVLVEELMKPANRAAILIVDPHGEYDTLVEMMNDQAFQDEDYRPEVKIFKPGDVNVRIGALGVSDLTYLLPDLSERMAYVLGRAFRDVRRNSQRDRGNAENWTKAELEIRIRQIGEGADEEDGNDRFAGTADALIWRLDRIFQHSVVFDDFKHLDLGELFRPGRCSVLQINEIDEREQQVMVATLLRRLFMARSKTEKGQASSGEEQYLPYPAFVLLEEAHHFGPAGVDVVSTKVLKRTLAEGRKFGVGIGLISQRPGKLDSDILSQCNTQFLLRIVNPVDQSRVAESVESVGRDLLRELPALTKGQVIIAGEAVNTPLLCRVRERFTPHGAESKDAPQAWVDYHSSIEEDWFERESALPVNAPRRGKSKMFKSD